MIEALVGLLRFAAPVAFAATGETVGQRAGVINIGLEGMMLGAAYFAMLGSLTTGSPAVGLLCGVGVALTLGAVQAYFTLRLAVDQIVVGTALNLFALGLTSTLYRARFGGSGQLISVPRLPQFGPGLDAALVALPVLVVAAAWGLFRTKWGLALRGVGEYPAAVEAAGYGVARLRFQATVVGSALAGLGGGYLALGVTGSFAENMTAGRGFVAIAMVTFGRWRPAWVLAACLLVGWVDSLQYELQARGLGIPAQILIALPYVLALVVLVAVGKGTAAPAALAVPYRRER